MTDTAGIVERLEYMRHRYVNQRAMWRKEDTQGASHLNECIETLGAAIERLRAEPPQEVVSLPPGRTKQDVANLVDIALQDALEDLGNGDGGRYDYDKMVASLRGNGLALVAATSGAPRTHQTIDPYTREEAAKVADAAAHKERSSGQHVARRKTATEIAENIAAYIRALGRES